MAILTTKSLHKQYIMGDYRVNALAGVDFLIDQGEFVAIMGPSGSGKSTLLYLLGGLDKASEGEVTIAGQRLSILNDNQVTLMRRRNVGFVFQFFNLLPTLSAEENVALPLIIDGRRLRDYQDRIKALLNMVGLADRSHHKPDQLSGGQQQRVAIARALVTEPSILLADEPTGNLDTNAGMAIMELLRRSCDELGQTIVVVTHDMRAATYADRVVFLRDGLIATQLTFESISDSAQRLRIVMETMEELQA